MVRREEIWKVEPESDEVILERLWRYEMDGIKKELAAYRKAVAAPASRRGNSTDRAYGRPPAQRARVAGLAGIRALTAAMRGEFE